MGEKIDRFRKFGREMNGRILGSGTTETKRFFALDSRLYEDGALPAKTKELLVSITIPHLREAHAVLRELES
jgi:ribonuclease HI